MIPPSKLQMNIPKKKRKLNMNEYLNEKSLTIKPSKTNVKNSKAFVGMPPSQKKHHSGSIKIKFIECHIERSKTKLIRRRTLFKKVFKILNKNFIKITNKCTLFKFLKAVELSKLTGIELCLLAIDGKRIDTYFSNQMLAQKIKPKLSELLECQIEFIEDKSNDSNKSNEKTE